jgi:hypothetical protein
MKRNKFNRKEKNLQSWWTYGTILFYNLTITKQNMTIFPQDSLQNLHLKRDQQSTFLC